MYKAKNINPNNLSNNFILDMFKALALPKQTVQSFIIKLSRLDYNTLKWYNKEMHNKFIADIVTDKLNKKDKTSYDVVQQALEEFKQLTLNSNKV